MGSIAACAAWAWRRRRTHCARHAWRAASRRGVQPHLAHGGAGRLLLVSAKGVDGLDSHTMCERGARGAARVECKGVTVGSGELDGARGSRFITAAGASLPALEAAVQLSITTFVMIFLSSTAGDGHDRWACPVLIHHKRGLCALQHRQRRAASGGASFAPRL